MGTVCPNCGNYPVLLLRDRKEVYYACIPCGISSPSADSVDEARAAWEALAKGSLPCEACGINGEDEG